MARETDEMNAFFTEVRQHIIAMPEVTNIVDEDTYEENAYMTMGSDPGGVFRREFHVDVSDSFKQSLEPGKMDDLELKRRLEDKNIDKLIIQDSNNNSDGLGPKLFGAKGSIQGYDDRDRDVGDMTIYAYYMLHSGE